MENIIIGNAISFLSAVCMALSCCSKDVKKVFGYQFLECVLLALASCFFGTYAAVVTLILCALRNIIIAAGKFTKPVMIIFTVAVAVCGFFVNNKGALGLLPVLATVEYTICCYYVKSLKGTKVSILVNLLMWIIYSFIIFDFSTAVSDSIIAAVDITVVLKMMFREKENPDAVNTRVL